MCGIAGILDWRSPPREDVAADMIATMHHRGPDHSSIVSHDCLTLAHCRLAIIDLDAASNQPMTDTRSGLSIVFNGEIYNYRALRHELEAAGATFRTNGDTEIVLQAFARWGTNCFSRLNGMFALAIWDDSRRRLVLARDRAGKKPLFFQRLADGGVVFASELKALRLHPQVSSSIDPAALSQYLSLAYVLEDRCILQGVEKVLPAHFLEFEHGRSMHPQCYWNLASFFHDKRTFRNEAAAAAELAELIDDAVRLRLVSDVPIGAFLSGGVDSSVIVAAMRVLQPASQTRTFSIGFDEQGYSELPEAKAMAAFLGVSHQDRIVDADMAHVLPMLAKAADEPFADTSIIPTYHLAKHARESITVALSGDGGDELFLGYETYIADQMHRLLSPVIPPALARGLASMSRTMVPSSFGKVSFDYKLKQFLAGLALPFERAHYSWREIFHRSDLQTLLNPDLAKQVLGHDPFDRFAQLFADVRSCHWLDQVSYVDIRTFMVDDVLVKVDRATMQSSLEARAPFLDHRIMEFAAQLPPRWKLYGLRTKHILKRSQRTRLPSDVLSRRKRGFNAPMAYWLTGGLTDLAYEATTAPAMLSWFRREAIDQLWTQHRDRKRDNSYRLSSLAILGMWMQSP